MKDHEGKTPAEFQETGHLLKAKGIMAGIKLHQGPLPPVIVVGGTWVKVGGKEAWIYAALDPRTLKAVYLEPFFVRDESNTNASWSIWWRHTGSGRSL